MRTKEEIMEAQKNAPTETHLTQCLLEVLIDIRDILEKIKLEHE